MGVEFGDYLQVTAVCYLDDQLGLNNYYFGVINQVGFPTEQAVAEDLAQRWQQPYVGALTSLAAFKGVILRNFKKLEEPFAPVSYYGRPKIAMVGQFGNVPMARQVSGLITVQSTRGGKGGKGRRYIPFPDAEANEIGGSGTPTNAYLNCLTQIVGAALSTITLGIGDSSITLKPLHQTYVKPEPPVPGYYDYYDVLPARTIYHDAWATQRRRGSFGRLNPDPFL